MWLIIRTPKLESRQKGQELLNLFSSIRGRSRIFQRRRRPQKWSANLLFGQFFSENCMKMKKIGPRGGVQNFSVQIRHSSYIKVYLNDDSMVFVQINSESLDIRGTHLVFRLDSVFFGLFSRFLYPSFYNPHAKHENRNIN